MAWFMNNPKSDRSKQNDLKIIGLWPHTTISVLFSFKSSLFSHFLLQEQFGPLLCKQETICEQVARIETEYIVKISLHIRGGGASQKNPFFQGLSCVSRGSGHFDQTSELLRHTQKLLRFRIYELCSVEILGSQKL